MAGVTVRYQVPVADALLATRAYWEPVDGFRLISVDGIWPDHPHVTLCTFEDDNAPEELAGRLVEPVISTDHDRAWVSERIQIGGAR